MANQLAPLSQKDLMAWFSPEAEVGDLTHGVEGGFAVVSVRGSKWRIKYQGEETPVVDAEGDPMPTMAVVIVKASPDISKLYYEASYTEGDSEAPDCWSLKGDVPDPASPSPQAVSCKACPQGRWGSRITEAGKKAKACGDSRRIAIVPAGDIENGQYGGPMLLRVPATSLPDLQQMGAKLERKGVSYKRISVKLGFDMEASYPKITFRPVEVLSDGQVSEVAQHLGGGVLDRIFEEAQEIEVAAAEAESAPMVDAVATEETRAATKAAKENAEAEEEAAKVEAAKAAKAEAAKAARAKKAAEKKAAAEEKPAEKPAAKQEEAPPAGSGSFEDAMNSIIDDFGA